MKRTLLFFTVILLQMGYFAHEGKAQCSIDFDGLGDTTSIQCGDSLTLSILQGSTQLGDDFNDMKLDSGWNSSQSVNFIQPCGTSLDGTPYAWLGDAADTPRVLTTAMMNVQCGGSICFDFKMAEQSGSAPCEGPDLPDEGVFLQYSTDAGNSWNTIQYFNPDTNCCGCGGGCGGYAPSPFVTWDTYCFAIPPAAQTDTTIFRWSQHQAGSGVDFDHWGIDNVELVGASCDSMVEFSYNGGPFDSTADTTVSLTNNGDYTVTAVTDSNDTCSSSIYVNVMGVPDLTVTASDCTITCLDTVQLNAAHSTAGTVDYTWTPDHQISNDTVQNPQAWPFKDTSYQVIAHQSGKPNCADTGYVDISVSCDTCFPPDPDLYMPTCHGDNDGMIVANMVGPRPPYNVVWEDSTGTVISQDTPVYTQDTLSGLATGEYTITTTDTMNCSADTTFTLPEPDSILVSVSNDTIICKGGTATVEAYPSGGNGPPYSYNWSGGLADTATQSVSPNSQTIYDVTVNDTNGCTSPSASLTVDVYPNIIVNTIPDDTICPGGSAQLEVLTTNGGSGSGYSYTWTNSSGDTVGTGPTTDVQPNTKSTYVVHVDDDCETPEGTDTMTVAIYSGQAGPDVNMAVSDSTGCYPHTVDFTCLVPSNKVKSTFWSFGDGTTSNDSGTTQHTYMEPGCYDVTLEVTSVNGCTEDSTFENAVCARPYPEANFVVDPPRGDVLDPELFLADRSAGAVKYLWSFEHTDSTSTLSEFEMEFPSDEPGTYEVTQWVENQYGCADSITKTVIIEGVHQLYVPNAFTPDGDGINDIFRPEGEGFAQEKYHFRIFDRWGKMVFQTKDPEKGWDGTIDGQKARPGVYVWQIQVKDAYTGQVHNKEGHVTLIR